MVNRKAKPAGRRGMRRDSQFTRDVVACLAEDHALQVTGRRLEDYSRAKLLLSGTPSAKEVASHIAGAGVTRTYRPGLPGAADRAMFIAFARGFVCEGLPDAFHRAYGRPEVAAGTPDPDTDEGNREIGAEIQSFIGWAGNGGNGASSAVGQFVKELLSSACTNLAITPITDHPGMPSETADQSLRSGLEVVLTMMYGGGAPTSLQSLLAVQGMGKLPAPDAAGYVDERTALSFADDVAEVAPSVEPLVAGAVTAAPELLAQGAALIRIVLNSPALSIPSLRDAETLDHLIGFLSPVGAALAAAPLGAMAAMAADPAQWAALEKWERGPSVETNG